AGRRPRPTRATTTGRGRRSSSAPWPTAARASTSRATTATPCRGCATRPWPRAVKRLNRPSMSASELLTGAVVEGGLARARPLRVGVVGALFLDRYLDLAAGLPEPSLETGLDAYQVVGVRPCPGAAGTVLNNLVALGAGRVVPIAVIGDDGEGYELRRALVAMGAVDPRGVFSTEGRRTPTYTKPMLLAPGQPDRELNRLDIQNRRPLPPAAEARVLDLLD